MCGWGCRIYGVCVGVCVGMYVRVCEGLMRGCVCVGCVCTGGV